MLVAESTDGRTFRSGYQEDVIPLTNVRRLQESGAYTFQSHYCNIPVCCPARASLWSGRYPHKIPHVQNDPRDPIYRKSNLQVEGVWNNFEGLPSNYNDTLFQVLERHGYQTHLSGKEDYTTGGHSMDTRLGSWTMYARFPYNIPNYSAWIEEEPYCRSNGTVYPTDPTNPQQSGAWAGDWRHLNESLTWIQNATNSNQPFFVYQGLDLVHPPYKTSQYYYDQIDPDKITIPHWPKVADMHPCDFQASMKKGCFPTSVEEIRQVYSIERRRRIRRIYYAMIAEFDVLVGKYLETLEELGIADNTIVIVTADHGDMQLEHFQFYKMSPYDASSNVPLVIYDPRRQSRQPIIESPTQHVDLFPTLLELAGISSNPNIAEHLDGSSLVSFMNPIERPPLRSSPPCSHPKYAVSQYHGDDNAMSWFLIVESMPCQPHDSNITDGTCRMKLVVWGTGSVAGVDNQLFDLTRDADETINLIHSPLHVNTVATLQEHLLSVVDYPLVATQVAQYNQDSFEWWRNHTHNWTAIVERQHMRWHHSWSKVGNETALQALEDWLSEPAEVKACRRELVWPPTFVPNDRESK